MNIYSEQDSLHHSDEEHPMSIDYLTTINAELIRENSILRAQFDQACLVGNKVTSLQQQLEELQSRNRELEFEKEDLEKRLQIAVQSKSDLEKKFQDELNIQDKIRKELGDQSKSEVENLKRELEKQHNLFCDQVEKLQESKTKLEIQAKMAFGHFEKVFQNASLHFQKDIRDLDDLIDTLAQPPAFGQEPNEKAFTARLNKEKKKVKYFQDLVRQLEVKNEKLEKVGTEKNTKIKKDFSKNSNESVRQTESLITKNEDLNTKIEILEKRLQKTENDLQKQKQMNMHLERENHQLKSSTPRQTEIKPMQRDIDLEDEISSELSKIDTLTEQLNAKDESAKEYERKIRELKKELNTANTEVDNYKKELRSLQSILDDTAGELDRLRNLNEKGSPQKISDVKRKNLGELKTKCRALEKQVDSLKKEYSDCARENAELKIERDGLKNSIKLNQSRIADLNEQNESLNDSLMKLTEHPVQIPTEEDFVPRSVFRSSAFDGDLNQILEEISMSPDVSAATKIQRSFFEISKYFNSLLKERENEIQATVGDLSQIRECLGQFFIDISITLTGNPITFNQFFVQQDAGSELVSAAKQLAREVGNLKKQNQILQNDFEALKKVYKPLEGASSVSQGLNILQKELKDSEIKSLSLKKENHSLRSALKKERVHRKDVTSKLEEQAMDFEENVKKSSAEFTSFQDERNYLRQIIQNQKKEIARLSEELNATKSELDDTNSKLSLYEDRPQDQVVVARDFSLEESSKQKVIDKLRKELHAMKEERDQHKNELRSVYEEKQLSEDKLSKYDIDRMEHISQFENLAGDLRRQLDKSRSDLDLTNNRFDELRKKYKKVQKENSILRRENDRLNNQNRSLIEQFEREKKLIETQNQAHVSTLEGHFNQKILDQKVTFEKEKKRILNSLAEAFGQFCDPSVALDEKGHSNLVSKVKDEMNRLMKSDLAVRHIVKATGGETTEIAVSRALYNNGKT